MNKKLKLIIITVLMIIFIIGCVGCNKNIQGNEMTGKITKDELTPEKIGYYSTLKLPIDNNATKITVLCATDVTTNNESVVVKELRRRTGLDVEIVAVPVATVKEKVKVLLASKEGLPDIANVGYRDDVNELGIQGAFEPIEQHLNELPNFKEIFYDKTDENKTANVIKNFRATDGNLYLFPSFQIARLVNHGMLYRKDIFDKHQIPMWNNKEEFYQALKKLKELYPNSVPMSSKTNTGIFTDLGYSWGIDGYNLFFYDYESKIWKYSHTQQSYKDMLDYLKKLYDEKLLDPEFLTDTQASWTAKMTQSEKSFVTWDWIGRMDMFYEQAKDTIPEYDLRYGNPLGGKVTSPPIASNCVSVKKGKNSLLALKLCDYLISPSGAQLMTLGIEGVTYEIDEKGFAKYYGFDEGKNIGINDLEEKYGLFISGLYKRFDKRSIYFNFSEKEAEAQKIMLEKPDGFIPESPSLTFTKEEKDTINKYKSALSKAAEEFSVKYILTENTGDEAWNSWLIQAKNLGAEIIVDIYNQAQTRYDQN